MKILNLKAIEQLAERDTWSNKLNPTAKLLVTLFYILLLASVEGEELAMILSLGAIPILWMFLSDVDMVLLFSQLIIPAIIGGSLGFFNVLIYREPMYVFEDFILTRGTISFFGIVLKSVFSIMSTLLLVSTTKLEDVGYALEKLKVPASFITVLLLVYRYLFMFVDEVTQTMTAYKLRDSKRKGIAIKVWASMIGPMVIRAYYHSMEVYQAMCLRGFEGMFYRTKKFKIRVTDMLFVVISVSIMMVVKNLWT